jgi:hypothetical protein
MEPFDPVRFGFILLPDFQIPGGVLVYERANHPAVNGRPDFLRLNIFLSKDANYVTIWNGLLEPIITEAKLRDDLEVELPPDFDFHDSYDETLFRGYIETAETAAHILKALRVEPLGARFALPQVLSGGTDNKLCCDMIE